MSFLAGRLAGKEAAYFLQESKHAVGKLAQKNSASNKIEGASLSAPVASPELEANADVLTEVLRHSLPAKIFKDETSGSSSFSASKCVLHSDPKNRSYVSPDALNPLRAYVSLLQVTFGPKRFHFFP